MSESAIGPAPEPPLHATDRPNGRIKPDLVAIGHNRQGERGTSYSAPRIAGLAALVIQALGERPEYNDPHEIAQYLKHPDNAVQYGSPHPNNVWGHGFVYLPQPTAPDNITVEQVSADQALTLTFDHTTWDAANADHSNVYYKYRILKAAPIQPVEVASNNILRPSATPQINVSNLDYGAQYSAFVTTCPGSAPPTNGEDESCGPESSVSNTLTIEPLTAPLNLTYELDYRSLILSWDAVPQADSFILTNPTTNRPFATTPNNFIYLTLYRRYGTTANIVVQARSGTNISEPTDPIQVAIPPVPPPTNLRITAQPESNRLFNITLDHTDWPFREEAGASLKYEVQFTSLMGIRERTTYTPLQLDNTTGSPTDTVELFPYQSFFFARARTCLTYYVDDCHEFSPTTPALFPNNPDAILPSSELLFITDGDTAVARWNPVPSATSYDVGIYHRDRSVTDIDLFDPDRFDTTNGETGITRTHGIISNIQLPLPRNHVFAVRVNSLLSEQFPTGANTARSLYDPEYRRERGQTLEDIQFHWSEEYGENSVFLDAGTQLGISWIWDRASAFHEIQKWNGNMGEWVTLKLHEPHPTNPYIRWETHEAALINNVPPAQTIHLRIRGIYGDNITKWSPTLEITRDSAPTSSTEPNPPSLPNVSDLQVSTTDRTTNSASLSWTQSQGATSYEIDFGDADNRVTATVTNATVNSLTPNTEYTFRVRARNGLETSHWSAPVSITTYPTAPTSLQAKLRPHSVRLIWNQVDGVDGYEVTVVGSDSTTNANDTDAVIHGLVSGSTYSFAVRSQSGDRKSTWSDSITVTLPQPPDEPNVTTTGLANGRVQLSWSAVTDADSYKVHQCDRHTGNWRTHPYTEQGQVQPFSITSSTTSATISGLTDQITYTFRAASVNEHGTTWSQPIDGTAGSETPDNTQPSPGGKLCPSEGAVPSNLQATVTTSGVSLTWTPGTKPRYVEQKVLRRVAGVSPIEWTEISVASNANAYTDTQGVSGTRYIYRIQALKANGVGDISNNQEVTFP